MRRLLRHPVNLDHRDDYRKTALHYAVDVDAPTVVEALIRAGANPNVVDGDNETPLHYSVQCSSPKVVHALLQFPQVNTDIRDNYGLTPLLHCALHGYYVKAKMLVDRHASFEVVNNDGHTPLHLAVRRGHYALAELFISSTAMGIRDHSGRSPLMLALMYGHHLIAEMLLEHHPDLTLRDELGMNLIHYAVVMNDVPTVEHMLAVTGYTINEPDSRGLTPLHLAIRITADDVIDTLLHFGANLNLQNLQGMTPLMEAVFRNDAGIVTKLVNYLSFNIGDAFADLELSDIEGNTAFHHAAKRNFFEICDILYENGANDMAVNNEGKTLRDYTVAYLYELQRFPTGNDDEIEPDDGVIVLN